MSVFTIQSNHITLIIDAHIYCCFLCIAIGIILSHMIFVSVQLVVRSDLVIRSLVPTPLQMEIQTTTALPEIQRKPLSVDHFNQKWHTLAGNPSSHMYTLQSGPSAQDLSTWSTLATSDAVHDRLIQLRLRTNELDVADKPQYSWSDPVQFRLTRPGTNMSASQLTTTSIRTLVSNYRSMNAIFDSF